MVNCRLFWQFSALVYGGGGCEWVIQGRSMRGSCVRDSALRPDELAPIWTAAKVWLTPSFVVRDSSHPLIEPGFCELLALWMNPLLLLLFSFVLCVCFGGGWIRRIVQCSQAPRRDQQIFISVIEERKFTWLVQWSLITMFTANRDRESDKCEQRWVEEFGRTGASLWRYKPQIWKENKNGFRRRTGARIYSFYAGNLILYCSMLHELKGIIQEVGIQQITASFVGAHILTLWCLTTTIVVVPHR